MVRRELLCLGLVVVVAGAMFAPSPAFACTLSEVKAGACSQGSGSDAEISDGQISVWEWLSTGGSEGQDVPSVDLPISGTGGTDIPSSPPPPPPPANCSPNNTALCAGTPSAPPAPEDPGEPVLTMSDVASFRPAPAEFGMQPDGWAVVGLSANFVADAGTHTRTGTLLGRQVEVRFTPARYAWAFSDGVTISSSTQGSTWEALGAREFTETATSRRFEASGRLTVRLVVSYTAEYRFAGSIWRTIAGTLDVPGAAREIVVGELDTVLTDGDCRTNPRGPGC